MKQLLAAISMVLVASAASAETQMVKSKWMNELTLWDVVWEDDAPRYQKWLLDNYDTPEEAGNWRINKLKAAYKFNVEYFPGVDQIFTNWEEADYSTLILNGAGTTGGYTGVRLWINQPESGFNTALNPLNQQVFISFVLNSDNEWFINGYSSGWEIYDLDPEPYAEQLLEQIEDTINVPTVANVFEYLNNLDEVSI